MGPHVSAGVVAGKTAIVTGAGRGIGRAIAILLAKEGARIVVADVGASIDGSGAGAGPAQSVADEINSAGGEAIASTLSITEPANADKIVGTALDAFGRVDILVNNAGILRDRFFHKMSVTDWNDVLAVHLNGCFYMSVACARRFREQGSGAFVHMTSTSGLVGNYGQANYAAAKAGLLGLTRTVAREMARKGITCNAVTPGVIETDMTTDVAEQLVGGVPAGRVGRPEEVAAAVAFLCSEEAAYVSGATVAVDGGLGA